MDFEHQCLKAHNECRKKHGLPPLRLNKDMCVYSQEWANTLSKRNILQHRGNHKYGENLFMISSTDPNIKITGEDPVKSWYQEIKDHIFDEEPSSLISGHFTQIVWKDTRELGVGMAKVGKRIVVVANYYPPGNIIGQFARNVPPPGSFTSESNNNAIFALSELKLREVRSPECDARKSHYEGTEGDFEGDFLAAHNEYRKRHGVSPLSLDRKLCKFSEEWAKILATKNTLEHRRNSPYGENIYCMHSSDPNFKITGHTPVDSWYEEMPEHPFGREPTSLKTGHFTQVVWKNSVSLGVGVAKSRQGSIYVVANYSPAGNFVGEYTKNVPPLIENTEPKKLNGQLKVNGFLSQSSSTENSLSKSINQVGNFDQFQLDALRIHNEYRRRHGVPLLKLSEEVSIQIAKCVLFILKIKSSEFENHSISWKFV